ncbi:MAG: hypothetical protein JSR64_15750 [Nitrospira sp.]|nr:hypothetical protein [Nitrospira sp.]
MTMDERIEAAARAAYADKGSYGDERLAWDAAASIVGEDEARATHEAFRSMARAAIATAFPELSGDKPTGWIAPLEVTKEMVMAGEDALEDFKDSDYDSGADGSTHSYTYFRSGHCKGMFEAMRDAYLGKGDGG